MRFGAARPSRFARPSQSPSSTPSASPPPRARAGAAPLVPAWPSSPHAHTCSLHAVWGHALHLWSGMASPPVRALLRELLSSKPVQRRAACRLRRHGCV